MIEGRRRKNRAINRAISSVRTRRGNPRGTEGILIVSRQDLKYISLAHSSRNSRPMNHRVERERENEKDGASASERANKRASE